MATAQANYIIQAGGNILSASTAGPNGLILPAGSTNVLTLSTYYNATGSADDYMGLTSFGLTGGIYKVTTSKTFVGAGFLWRGSGTAGIGFSFGYADTAISSRTASAPTTPIYYAGGSSQYPITYLNAADTSYYWYPLTVTFPSGKYPFIRVNNAGEYGITVVGLEV